MPVTTSGALNTQLGLIAPSGAYEAGTSYGDDQLNWVLSETGLYTILVMDVWLGSTGGYNISPDRYTFTVRPGIYDPSPTDKSTISNRNPVLSWAAVSGASGYDVYFGSDITQPLAQIPGIPDNSLPLASLEYEKSYYWHVVAHTNDGDIEGPYWWFKVAGQTGSLRVTIIPQAVIDAGRTLMEGGRWGLAEQRSHAFGYSCWPAHG